MRINPDISGMNISVNASDLAQLLALASDYNRLRLQLAVTESKNNRMRMELTKYQSICERKRNSGAGASVEPQKVKTKADETKTDACLLTIGTEGRVSGGDRAGNFTEATNERVD